MTGARVLLWSASGDYTACRKVGGTLRKLNSAAFIHRSRDIRWCRRARTPRSIRQPSFRSFLYISLPPSSSLSFLCWRATRPVPRPPKSASVVRPMVPPSVHQAFAAPLRSMLQIHRSIRIDQPTTDRHPPSFPDNIWQTLVL